MISLEDEARIIRKPQEEVADERRRCAALSDNVKYGLITILGGAVGNISAYAAVYYHDKDIINCAACGALALLCGVSVIKSIYSFTKFSINYARGIKNPKIMSDYLKQEYPNANLLGPVYVDDMGNLKN